MCRHPLQKNFSETELIKENWTKIQLAYHILHTIIYYIQLAYHIYHILDLFDLQTLVQVA